MVDDTVSKRAMKFKSRMMMEMTRRQLPGLLALPLAAQSPSPFGERGDVPCVAAMAASADRVLFEAAEGTAIDSVFSIASMTKAVTSAAALRLVEEGKLSLDAPVPFLRGYRVLAGFTKGGTPRLRPPKRPATLRHLLTHTSGLSYSTWDADLKRAQARGAKNLLAFDPGERWQYGTGIDYAGRWIETITGTSLEEHFQTVFFRPLGMKDTSFLVSAERFPKLVPLWRRAADGVLRPDEHKPPAPPNSFNGGGGLSSTAGDYLRFLRMILRRGEGILGPRALAWMQTNAIGDLRAGILRTTNPAVSIDVDLHPGHVDHHSLAFLLNPKPHAGGRGSGSLAWAGLANTFFWIDPARDRCGVVLMQFLPFCDPAALRVLRQFERFVYERY